MNVDAQQRNLLIAGAALLAAFVAGGLAGGAVGAMIADRGLRHEGVQVRAIRPPGTFEIPAPARLPHGGIFFHRLDEPIGPGLGLSEDQQTRVNSLLEEQREKADRLMAEMEPRLKALMDSTNTAIEEALSAEQRDRFRRMQRERRDVIIRKFVEPAPLERIP